MFGWLGKGVYMWIENDMKVWEEVEVGVVDVGVI